MSISTALSPGSTNHFMARVTYLHFLIQVLIFFHFIGTSFPNFTSTFSQRRNILLLQQRIMLATMECMVVTGLAARNADGSRILEFPDGLNLVICNTLFMKQESKLVTHVAGSAKSTVDYIMVRQGIKSRFVMSRSFQTKSACQSINF